MLEAGHSDMVDGGDFIVEGFSICSTAGVLFWAATPKVGEVADLLLLDRLVNFSPFPAITKSG
jgi:hypothetical protein